jgi:hypothetical protein
MLILREASHQRGAVPEPRHPDGHVERAAARRHAILAGGRVGDQVDERLADDCDDKPHVMNG